MKFKEVIKKSLDRFAADRQDDTISDDTLTNERILDELTQVFRQKLEQESVGQRMLYPMSFNVFMDSDDYEDRLHSLPFIIDEVVDAFYKIMIDMESKYPKYTSPANEWYFQFSPCRMGSIPMSDFIQLTIRHGHITTLAKLMAPGTNNDSNTFVDSNTRVSIKMDDSNVMKDVNINWNAIKKLDILGEGVYRRKFDDTLGRGGSPRNADEISMGESNGLAELSYSKAGLSYHFIMKDSTIHISGKNEMRRGRSFFILESENIKDSHIQIKYIVNEKKFQLAAFGPTRLNSRKVAESCGGNILWYDLANHSEIFINNEISVKFVIK